MKNKKIKNHITEGQRYVIMSYLRVGLCPAEIARLINKDRSVVCREIKRNKNRFGRYIAAQAQESADIRKERFSAPRKLFPWVRREVVRLLTEEQRSPEQICGWMKRKGMEWVSHETIYKLVREDKANGGNLYKHLRHRGKHRRRPVGKFIPIRNRVGIKERPGIVDKRERFGDWEMDTIVGRNGTDAIVVLTERLTRFTMMARSPKGKNAESVADKDIDARWTKKRKETFYGYTDSVGICKKTKLIHGYSVCPANRHDSKETGKVLDAIGSKRKGEALEADAGYTGTEAEIKARGMEPVICEKGTKGHPLTDEQKESNRQKSKTRCRVEHVFGFMEQTMGGLVFRGVGIIRAKANIALTNLVYNMCRLVQIRKYHAEWMVC